MSKETTTPEKDFDTEDEIQILERQICELELQEAKLEKEIEAKWEEYRKLKNL